MARSGSMVCVVAIVLLVALFASPAKCRSLADAGGADAAMAAAAAPSSRASSDGGVRRPSSETDPVFCIKRNCVYAGRGNAECFCCATDRSCYDTRGKCNANCV